MEHESPTFYDKGPHRLLWAGSWAAGWRPTLEQERGSKRKPDVSTRLTVIVSYLHWLRKTHLLLHCVPLYLVDKRNYSYWVPPKKVR